MNNQFEITSVHARQIFDSRSNPTVEVDIGLRCGVTGRGIAPSGASTGIFEALELRDGDKNRLGGKTVLKAVEHVNTIIAPALTGMDASNQVLIDKTLLELDGTENKSKLGANAILASSLAAAYAAAQAKQVPLFMHLGGVNAKTLPVPMIQIIGGGAHAKGSIDIQDFLVIPMSAKSFSSGYEMVVNVYNAAKKVLASHGKPLSIADEGGFWPTDFKTNEEGLQLLTESIIAAGYTPFDDVAIALDIAASEFYDKEKKRYVFHCENRSFTSEEFACELVSWTKKYPIISIEDGMSELDWEGHAILTEKLGSLVQLIGDDLFTTNIDRIKTGIEKHACNSVLIKMNQIGTITETLDAIEYTKNNGYLPVISARSGETEDAAIVHLAIASNAGQLKVGSVARSERTVKWNEVLRMEEYLGVCAQYPSKSVFERIIRF